jgi:carotenoid 1,2-hydratase
VNPYSHVRPGGYAWWYFDAVSDDGARALTAIFFVGSVFSPDYAARIRRGEAARAEEHLAVNVALYERGRKRAWVMTEHGERALGGIGDGGPRIGDSAVERDGTHLRVRVVERSAPFLLALAGVGARVEGTIDVEPHAPALDPVELAVRPSRGDANGSSDGLDGERHWWHVLVPRARVRVRFTRPHFVFDGVGYHDVNAGDGRLERTFSSWSWARFHQANRTIIVYATHQRSGASRALVVDAHDGAPAAARPAALLPEGERAPLPWGLAMPRWFAVDDGGHALRCRPTRLYEAAPFYARYAATLETPETTPDHRPDKTPDHRPDKTPDNGNVRRVTGVGEYLDLDRFAERGVQFLLRFKMRRI